MQASVPGRCVCDAKLLRDSKIVDCPKGNKRRINFELHLATATQACPLWVRSRHLHRTSLCLLWANSGHHSDVVLLQKKISRPRQENRRPVLKFVGFDSETEMLALKEPVGRRTSGHWLA